MSSRNPLLSLWLLSAFESAFDWLEWRLAKLAYERRKREDEKQRRTDLKKELQTGFELHSESL